MPNSLQWRWLWRLSIPQRCKIFLWLALNDRLPSNSSKPAPHIVDTASSTCPFCHAQETLLHTLRDCPRAATVWCHLVAPHHQHGFFCCTLWDWMVTYLQQPWSCVNNGNDNDNDGDDNKDSVLFAATVWLLWKDRRTWDYDGRRDSSTGRVIQRMETLAEDYGRVVMMEHSAPSPAVRYVSWCFYWNQPPSQPQLRMIADGSQLVFPKL
ncbi:hypothetical protein HN51_001822 [Arachis hypogaea]|nr:Putative ribonuclease H protein [Arachis hypogaea]